MKRFLMLCVAFKCLVVLNAQQTTLPVQVAALSKGKKVIDSNALKDWVNFESDVLVSGNGEYIRYHYSFGGGNNRTLVLSTAQGNQKRSFTGVDYGTGFFSKDNRQFYFKKSDSLFFMQLADMSTRVIGGVQAILQPDEDKGKWLAYIRKSEPSRLILLDMATNKEYTYDSVVEYAFNRTGSAIMLRTAATAGSNTVQTLRKLNLLTLKMDDLWMAGSEEMREINNYAVNDNGDQVVFQVKVNNVPSGLPVQALYEIWYFKDGMARGEKKADDKAEGIDNGKYINFMMPQFSRNGQYLLFQVYNPSVPEADPDAVMVDVWNYRDTLLQCTQLGQRIRPGLTVAMPIEGSNKVITLTKDFEQMVASSEVTSEAVIAYNAQGDRFWLKQDNINWLVSFKDGSRKQLPAGNKTLFFSPKGKYLLYFDAVDFNYYRYDLGTNSATCISCNVPKGYLAFEGIVNADRSKNGPLGPIGVAGWNEDESFMVYEDYDIWKINPADGKATNMTNGFGRKSNIKLRVTNGMVSMSDPVFFKKGEKVLLTAFNLSNKYNGFYQASFDKINDPSLLVMGPYVFHLVAHNLLPVNAQNFMAGIGMAPVQIKTGKSWIIKRQSTSEASNLYYTTDFKIFKPLTDFAPQRDYNWPTTELIQWKQYDGTYSQGILYKPGDFDSTKKYPVIINYYQQRTHRMYQFPTPEYTIANIDVAWFATRGYLVFTPDIFKKTEEPGVGVYNAIVSASDYLAKLAYVDSTKMGINGHSIGGGLTNFLVTHTNRFAAALECAGVSNYISASLQLGRVFYEVSRLEGMENYLGNVSLWENPEKWLLTSPIMNADKVTTPLLIMHNKSDGGVPWPQAVEMFIALRRLQKPVWMLQYDNGGHSLYGIPREAKDFTTRITQFFDHYLKDAPAPKWMSQGVPARLKGISTGYELESSYNRLK
ncbi:MAG: prolyl oligopeptidase family serine peptidase [Candidatus Pseudobacter hemicellulosilyticus]|uniref:Prolyl oligopeptidase family serine peptidase n=1 Tax=Candidatus Pseudobacter hemicellulosilyticus TaxID=3121375 RepID=A0AAJ5WRS3_9BACT|nr:MAG: prolyl oligopeptidase family serine peptidase [Pseudobacter sp.]